MGKSSSGKDSIYRKLESTEEFGLKRLVIYTTRPIRDGEKEGREYTKKQGIVQNGDRIDKSTKIKKTIL